MPVLWKAVDTSPQGMVVTATGPCPKSTRRVRKAAGTETMRPPRRTAPPLARFSTMVMAVPCDSPPPTDWKDG
jgi:hypothetical protein